MTDLRAGAADKSPDRISGMFDAIAGLQPARIPLQWIVRPDLPHGIDPEGIAAGGKFLRAMLAG